MEKMKASGAISTVSTITSATVAGLFVGAGPRNLLVAYHDGETTASFGAVPEEPYPAAIDSSDTPGIAGAGTQPARPTWGSATTTACDGPPIEKPPVDAGAAAKAICPTGATGAAIASAARGATGGKAAAGVGAIWNAGAGAGGNVAGGAVGATATAGAGAAAYPPAEVTGVFGGGKDPEKTG